MIQPPDDDRDLTHFLHRYRPNPPPAHPELEDQILNALPRRTRRSRWIIPSTIAASLVSAIATYQILQPRSSEFVDTAAIETYMESNWSNTMHGTLNTATEPTTPEDIALVDFTE